MCKVVNRRRSGEKKVHNEGRCYVEIDFIARLSDLAGQGVLQAPERNRHLSHLHTGGHLAISKLYRTETMKSRVKVHIVQQLLLQDIDG
jgi:hypothetical protein